MPNICNQQIIPRYCKNSLIWGNYKISGKALKEGVPGVYLVLLFDRLTNSIIRTCFSKSNGDYLFENLPNKSFTVLALNGTSLPLLNAAISDYVYPEQM